MKKLGVLLVLFCLFSLSVLAQTRTADFSGEWTLDVGKSKLGDRARIESMTLNVTQNEKELRVETTAKRSTPPEGEGRGGRAMMRGGGLGDGTAIYSLEGKETFAEGAMGGQATLKAEFEKNGRLKLSKSQSVNAPMGQMNVNSKETWELLDDGRTLKILRDIETPRGTMSSEMIFTKKQS